MNTRNIPHRIPFADTYPVIQIPSAKLFPSEALVGEDTTESFPREYRQLLLQKPTLYVQGQPQALHLLEALPRRGFAIVGTRRASPRALQWVEDTLGDLSSSPIICISGFALGIDQRAHWAALRNGIPTVAFLGTPLDRDYPRGSFALREKVLQSGGLLISECTPGSRVFSSHFLDRNRWIAALTRAVWLVQAPIRSGARNTLTHARNLKRAIYVSPAFAEDRDFSGNLAELESHPEQSRIFLGARSLGETWIDLSSQLALGLRTELASDDSHLASELDIYSDLLVREISLRTGVDGGVGLERLLEWACDRGWEFPDFYERLTLAVTQQRVTDNQGWFTARKRPPQLNALEKQNLLRLR